jgi:two-component system LytT family response regulator
MKINCIIVDDEPLARQKLESYVAQLDYLNLMGSFGDGLSALQFLRKQTVDLLFLDIQMDELTGIQVLEALTEKPEVILTTAYDAYALKGL